MQRLQKKMGAAASITEPIDKTTAQSLLGDKFDEAQFDANAEDGKIDVQKWAELAAAVSSVSESDAAAAPANAAPVASSGTGGAGSSSETDAVVVTANAAPAATSETNDATVIDTTKTRDDEPWKTEYCVFGVCSSKDDAAMRELYQADGTLQVVEEKGAPRFTYFGVPTKTTGPADDFGAKPPEPPVKPYSQRNFWLASFDSKDAYFIDHKARASNQAFVPQFMSLWSTMPSEGPAGMEKPQIFALAKGAQDGMYMGPYYHLEKEGVAADAEVYVVAVYARAKDAEAAVRIVELVKVYGPQQLAAEEGALRVSLVPPHLTGVPGVGATDLPGGFPSDDEVTVTWVESFSNLEAYEAHKDARHVTELFGEVKKELPDGGELVFLEFPGSNHFAKPSSA